MNDVKKPKLTAKQQEVVNLMAAGWVLQWTRAAFGDRIPAMAWLTKDDAHRSGKIRSDVPEQLLRKGVFEESGRDKSFVPVVQYRLTALGKSLAEQPQ
jgi:hypothetical protein